MVIPHEKYNRLVARVSPQIAGKFIMSYGAYAFKPHLHLSTNVA